MNFGEKLRIKSNTFKAVSIGLVSAFVPQIAAAQEAAETAAEAAPVDAAAGAGAYTPLGPDMIKGQPVDGAIWFQDQHSPIGETALWMHDVVLMPIITVICLFVLALLLWIVVRYNKRRNPVPSKTSHNSLLEVVWTLIPVLILVGIAVPSISLLAKQYESPPKDALTVKVTGYQWYWGYSYPDNGDFEVISNMMSEEEAHEKGFPGHLEVDNRLVLPAGVPIRLQTTAADVIHSFAVPSLWFKIDAVPGRLNERLLMINEPGIYYGQCSELCGARHGYMPIAVEAVTKEQFAAWVATQGGTMGGEEAPAAAPVAEDAAPAAPEEAAAPAV